MPGIHYALPSHFLKYLIGRDIVNDTNNSHCFSPLGIQFVDLNLGSDNLFFEFFDIPNVGLIQFCNYTLQPFDFLFLQVRLLVFVHSSF